MNHLLASLLSTILILSCSRSIVDNAPIKEFEEVRAESTTDFLNSLGVVSSVSRRGETLEGTIECMEYTGLRWIRTGYEGGVPVSDLIELNEKAGVKISYGLLSGGSDIPRLIDGAKLLAGKRALIAVEGPNEPNNWEINYKGEQGGGAKSWMTVAKLQRDLYKMAKKESLLADVPVWSISENGAQTDNVGLQFLSVPETANTLMPAGTEFADFANCHNYICHPSWPGLHDNQAWLSSGVDKDVPVDGLFGNYGTTWRNKFQGYSADELEKLPRVTTETGIAVGQDDVVTEELQARLFLDLYLSQYKRGWKYTAIYLLKGRADEPAHEAYAFYKLDYTPKKAAEYLHNFTEILSDNKDVESPGFLEYSLESDTSTVHDLLLRRSDGVFQLIVWGENFVSPAKQVGVIFRKRHKQIKVYNPILGTTPIDSFNDIDEVQLKVSNHPYILEIR